MKLVLHLVLLALAFVGGMALERNLKPGPAVASEAPSVTEGSGLQLERGTVAQEPESSQHQRDQEPQDKPIPTLAHLLTLSEERDRHRALDHVPSSELVIMLDELQKSDDRSPQARALKRVLYDRWANDEPLAALKHVLANEKNPRLQNGIIHHAFSRLAEGNVTAALEAFSGLETRRQREEAIAAISHRAKLEDMPMLADFFLNNDLPNLPHEVFFRHWAERDPGVNMFDYAGAGGRRSLLAAIEGMAMSDPEGALSMGQQLGTEGIRAALEALSHHNPQLAAEAFDELPPGRQRNDLARQLAHRMAREDIQSALSWTETLDPASKREALQEVSEEWARQDPQGAAEHALTLADPHQQREAVSQATHHWARDNPSAALEWANSLEGDTGLAAIRGVIGTIADNDPQAAASMIDQLDFSSGPADAYSDMAGDLAGHWSEFDPQAAANWAQSLPNENDAQHHAFERVADHWVEQDTLRASEWIGGLPEGELRDIAASRLVEHIAPSDPDAAYEWALSLSDPGHQTEMLHQVFEQWQERDPEGAEATLNAAPISNEQRQELGELFN